jgi:hypothetical protein
LSSEDEWAPSEWSRLGIELAITPLGDLALLIGRPALRWLPSELVRLQHLASIAASVTPPTPIERGGALASRPRD